VGVCIQSNHVGSRSIPGSRGLAAAYDSGGRQSDLVRAVLFRLGSALVLVGDDEDCLVSEVTADERILDALDM
jgi:hypothetical protein